MNNLVIGFSMLFFGVGIAIGLTAGLSLALGEIMYRDKKLKNKGNKQYIVIELAEGYKHLYGYKIFDNYDDAYVFYKEADEMNQIKYAEIGEYNFIEAFDERGE